MKRLTLPSPKIAVLSGLIAAVFAYDWRTNYSTPGPWIFGTRPVLLATGLLLVLVWMLTPRRATHWSRRRRNEIDRNLTLMIAGVALLGGFLNEGRALAVWVEGIVPLGLAFGYYLLGGRGKSIRASTESWGLEVAARVLLGLAAVSLSLRLAGQETSSYLFPPASWPVRLLVLYSLLWFCARAVLAGLTWGRLVAIGLTATETLMLVGKPLVFATSVGLTSMLGILLLNPRVQREAPVRFLKGLGSACAALVLTIAVSPQIANALQETFETRYLHRTADWEALNARARFEIASGGRVTDVWPAAIKAFREHPWMGSGFGMQFIPTSAGAWDEGINLHNSYLDTAVAIGIVGCVPLVALMWRWFVAVKRALWLKPSAGLIASVAWATALMAFGLGGTLRVLPTILCMAAFLLGVAQYEAREVVFASRGERPLGLPLGRRR